MKILKLSRPAYRDGERPMILSIPFDKVETIESQIGSENNYCKVNGIEVKETYSFVMNMLEWEGI